MNKLGLYFRREKLEALLRGDISNAVVNRYFVYGFQATGTHLCGSLEATCTPAAVLLQARYSQMAWESLAEIHSTDDRKLEAQALLQFVHTTIIMGFEIGAQFYLSRVCTIIEKAGLQFLPVYGRPDELSEQVREDAAVLSQAMFLDIYFSLTSGGSISRMTKRLEKEFRLDLEVRTLRSFFVVGLEINSAARPSKRTHTCSAYVR